MNDRNSRHTSFSFTYSNRIVTIGTKQLNDPNEAIGHQDLRREPMNFVIN
ncbi:MAG: hypothetical protein IPP77_11755 [Bacteroidetes bacterium]|nr:hypothetical protein [Bacteroidota bacterium]